MSDYKNFTPYPYGDELCGRWGGLPGRKWNCEGMGHTCMKDECCEPAVVVVQGETDSFGCEVNTFCDACFDFYEAAIEEIELQCEDCGSTKEVKPFRDPEEGNGGPVYEYCAECRHRIISRFEDEIHGYDDDED